MKTTYLVPLCTISLLGAVSLGTLTTVDAAETKANTQFLEGTTEIPDPTKDFTLVKPGTEEEISIAKEAGSSTSGPLAFSFVPNLEFGSEGNNISALTERYDVLPTLYSKKGETDLREISPFLQVTDVRGSSAGYKVSVKQEDVFKSGTKELPTTRIELAEATTTVTGGSAATLASFDLTPGAKDIPVGSAASPEVILTGTSTGTGSVGSLVFKKDYKPETTGSTIVTEAKNRVSGIKLRVPTSDAPEKALNYSATLTWSLDNVE